MIASTLFYGVLAGLAAGAAAQTTEGTSTTTCTSTLTMTVTIKTCSPGAPGCSIPANTTTVYPTVHSSTYSPKANLTSAYPTYSANATTYVQPTLSSKATTEVVLPTATGIASQPPAAAATTPATGAAGSLFVQSGVMLGALAAGIALLA